MSYSIRFVFVEEHGLILTQTQTHTRSCIRTKSSQIHTYTHVYTLLSSSKSATQSHSITTTSAPLHCCNSLRGCPHIISSLLLPLQLLLEKNPNDNNKSTYYYLSSLTVMSTQTKCGKSLKFARLTTHYMLKNDTSTIDVALLRDVRVA